jgi:tetratricopeptide (TPR) repeat protein
MNIPMLNDPDWEKIEPTPNRKMSRVYSMLVSVAHFLRENGHLDEAIKVLKALSWGDETYECGDYAYELGLCFEAKNDFATALHYFEIALRENPHVFGRAEAVARLRNRP